MRIPTINIFYEITIILLITLANSCFVSAQNKDEIALGTKHLIHSNALEEDREYWVSLPESYNGEAMDYKRYPLLIVLDGHAHFKSITGIVNYMSTGFNGNRKIPEMIVVAIQNVNRNRDFTPDKIITKRKNDFGGGEKFLSFLEEELIPQLDKDYRKIPYRMLYGHSLGGLLATHAYMKEKTSFNSFIAVDPSFGSWDDITMDKKLDAVTDKSFDRYIYIASANWGKRNFKNRVRHVRLFEALNGKCEGEIPAQLEYFENENHGSVPIIAFYNGLISIFKGYGIDYREVDDRAHLIQHFQSLSQRLSWDFDPPEALVNRVGYRIKRSNKTQAIEIFKLNIENFPNSYNAYDSLADAYESNGEVKEALKYYKKSLELNPAHKHAKAKIEDLSNN